MSSTNNIKVVARFRPQNKVELASGGEPIVEFTSDDTCSIQSKEANGTFTFDRVFDMGCRQSDVFDFSIRPTVDDIFNGYNGTVFAYGQTGAGKSYTMMGADIDDETTKGIIPRIVEQIFASILSSPSNIEYTVRVSYMEIYMERIRDLLAPLNDNLPIHEEKSRGVYVKGLLEIYVSSVAEVYEVMRRGGQARAVAATNMNQESSRSHSIFVITVGQKNVETGSAKSGQLFLVDLAGSEKVGKTGASGQTLEEAKKINKSLSALGMVINALTDGKSTHIPYRDSKLTRILQESLGGNSRTTLIINCSPSSYNDAETISTLRFGVRAKAIRNKAKINAELSPAELKALLKKAQLQITTYEAYIHSLDQEVGQWRCGESVPKEKWTPSVDRIDPSTVSAPRKPLGIESRASTGTPSTPSRTSESRRTVHSGIETPASRPDSRMDLYRAGTPVIPLEKDEKEEFLRRENELQDQLAEKESALSAVEKALRAVQEEVDLLRARDKEQSRENEGLSSELNDVRLQLERVCFENKELNITTDSSKDQIKELTAELDETKKELLEARLAAKEVGMGDDEKEIRKREKMKKMIAGFELGDEVYGENETAISKAISRVDSGLEMDPNDGSGVFSVDELRELRRLLSESRGIVREAGRSMKERREAEIANFERREELEQKLFQSEQERAKLLESGLEGRDTEAIKADLAAISSSLEAERESIIKELRAGLAQVTKENTKLKDEAEKLQKQLATAGNGQANDKTIQQKLDELDAVKKSLMKDLQNRCERVVELEISLDETREQYNNVLRNHTSRSQQAKMAALERNLDQLTMVQHHLVVQNNTLKKEVAIATRRLVARNERIHSLETLLQESQEKLTTANHRFEAQLTAVKERLETAAKSNSGRGTGNDGTMSGVGTGGNAIGGGTGGGAATSFLSPAFVAAAALGGSRIAKPLRGGGDAAAAGPGVGVATASVPTTVHNKRTSWFFNK